MASVPMRFGLSGGGAKGKQSVFARYRIHYHGVRIAEGRLDTATIFGDYDGSLDQFVTCADAGSL